MWGHRGECHIPISIKKIIKATVAQPSVCELGPSWVPLMIVLASLGKVAQCLSAFYLCAPIFLGTMPVGVALLAGVRDWHRGLGCFLLLEGEDPLVAVPSAATQIPGLLGVSVLSFIFI